MNKIFFILGGLIGFTLCVFFAGKREKKEGILPSLILHLGNYNIHFHHWLLALILLGVMFSYKYYDGFIHGLLLGIIIQGLTYHDFYSIITKTKISGLGFLGLTYNFRNYSKTHRRVKQK